MINHTKHFNWGSKSYKYLLFSVLLFVPLSLIIVTSTKVFAINENTSYVPNFISNFDKQCSGYKHYQNVWLSNGGDNSVTTTVISQGTDSVDLRLNVISAHCDTNIDGSGNIVNQQIQTTRTTLITRGVKVLDYGSNQVGSPSITSGLVVGSYWDLNYSDSHSNNYRYIKDGGINDQPIYRSFTVSGLSGLSPGDYKVVVNSSVNMVHKYNYGYRCVDPNGPNNASSLDDLNCGDAGPEWETMIKILPRPPVGVIDSALCGVNNGASLIRGWAYDPQFPAAPIEIHVYPHNPTQGPAIFGRADKFTNPASYPGMGGFSNPPVVVSGNHHYQIDVSEWDDTYVNQFDVYAIATSSPSGDQDPNLSNTWLGLATMNRACKPPTCSVNSSGSVEVNQPFSITLSYNYSPRLYGRPYQPTGYVNINGGANSSYGFPNSKSGNNHIFGPGDFSPSSWPNVGTLTINASINQPGVYGSICNGQVKVGRKPYYKIYGNDAAVGYGFNSGITQCSSPNSSATFRGFNKDGTTPPANYDYMRGAGAQFGLFALGVIQEVPSSGMKAGDALNDQTFANTTIFNSFKTPKSDYGGQGGLGSCMPDYFSRNTIPGSGTQVSSVNPGGNTAGDQNGNGATISYVSPSAGNSYVTINAATLANNKKHTVYVKGDAVIAGNIAYTSFGNLDNASNFTLVVDGNIYIDNSVSQLDGLYIAQPKTDPNKGKIITCANGNSQIAGNLMATSGANGCANKLIVNGSFIAKEVKLLRTNGSLSNGLANPDTNFNFTFGSIVPAPSPISADCIRIEEGSDWASRGTWHDNGLCTDPGAVSRYGLEWKNNAPLKPLPGHTPNTFNEDYADEQTIGSKTCVMFKEPTEWLIDNDPNGYPGHTPYQNATSWEDNYLCYDNSAHHNLRFYYGGPKPFPGTTALNNSVPNWGNLVTVPPNNTWQGVNQIIGDPSYGRQVRCVRISEPSDAGAILPNPDNHNGTWGDNWLCEDVISSSLSSAEPLSDGNIAEVFNFSPELYVQQTVWSTSSSSTIGTYDSVGNLPPVF